MSWGRWLVGVIALTLGACGGDEAGPVLLVNGGGSSPSDIAVDEEHVYWMDGAYGIHRVTKQGERRPDLAPPTYSNNVMADEDGIYCAGFSVDDTGEPVVEIAKIPKRGGDPLILATQSNPSPLFPNDDPVVDEEYFYWALTETIPGELYEPGSLYRVRKTGGDPEVVAEAVLKGQVHLAVDDEFLYWADEERWRIGRVPKAGGTPEILADGVVVPRGIALSESHVYFASSGHPVNGYEDGYVARVPKTGGEPEIVIMQTHPFHLDGDDRGLFWVVVESSTGPRDGEIWAMDFADEVPRLLADRVYLPWYVAADATHVYLVAAYESIVWQIKR